MAASILAYFTAIIGANLLTARFGLVPVGLGLVATAGAYAAGVSFVARDAVQDTAGRRAVLATIAAGGLASAWLATPALAVASVVAFTVAELADLAVYTPLREHGYLRAAVASNQVGAVVDTALFLSIAGFPLAAMPGQLIGKAWATIAAVLVVIAIRTARAVPRDPLDRDGS